MAAKIFQNMAIMGLLVLPSVRPLNGHKSGLSWHVHVLSISISATPVICFVGMTSLSLTLRLNSAAYNGQTNPPFDRAVAVKMEPQQQMTEFDVSARVTALTYCRASNEAMALKLWSHGYDAPGPLVARNEQGHCQT